jgi:SSS family solute:Na+ symporter
MDKFSTLNEKAMHMGSNPEMPWPILLLGIWIPNFYYWGLNQYITQRILGSASLAEGQKGLVFAGALKLIVPFVIVIPGIIAFNLYSKDMEKNAGDTMAVYETAAAKPDSIEVFKLDPRWVVAHPEKANEVEVYNESVKARTDAKAIKVVEIHQYKYDSALSLLITKLIPHNKGILGFVLAALLGAIISSLAAILNAASTLLTMDVYHRYTNPNASQFKLVSMGRIFIGVFVVLGCLVAPLLDNYKSIFEYIQKVQGFVSTGILAVFIYGLFNRTSGKWAGVIGLIANPIVYGILTIWLFPKMHFLYSMSYCLIIVLAIMIVYGLIWKQEEKVVFENNTTMDLTSSKGALIWGLVVCAATVALYVIFW